LLAVPAGGSAPAAPAAAETLVLSPLNMLAETHSHAFVMSFTSTYKQLSGSLRFDPQAKTCAIDVRFVVRSLTAPNAMLRSQTMSKKFLDPDDFPETRYVGMCQGDRLVGSLTLRGQTHPFDMTLTYFGGAGVPVAIHGEGILNRYDWGVGGLSGIVSKNIRITNDISLDGAPPISRHAGS
jgi:polyisoprenoid-binding protein YceI